MRRPSDLYLMAFAAAGLALSVPAATVLADLTPVPEMMRTIAAVLFCTSVTLAVLVAVRAGRRQPPRGFDVLPMSGADRGDRIGEPNRTLP